MKFKWFSTGISSIQELKSFYRSLVKGNHPDCGGSEKSMKEINNEYEKLFDTVKNHSEVKADKYANMNDGFREIIEKLIQLHNINIEICGSWVWVGGNTKPVKDSLKKSGLFFSAKKCMWYWKPKGYKKYGYKTYTIDEIRSRYGSTKIENKNEKLESVAY